MKSQPRKPATARRLARYLRAGMPLLALALLLSASSALLMLLVPLFIGRAVDCLVGAGMVEMSRLLSYLLKIALSAGGASLLAYLANLADNRVAYRAVERLRGEAFASLNRASLSFLDAHSQGDLASRVTADAERFGEGFLMALTQLPSGVVTICGTLAVMFAIRPQIALVLLLVTPLSLLAARFLSSRTYRFFVRETSDRGSLAALAKETVDGREALRALGGEERACADFAARNEALRASSEKATFFSSLTNPVTRFLGSFSYAAVALAGALFVLRDPASFGVGMFSSFLSYVNQYNKPFNEVTGVLTELQGALASAERLLEIIDLPDASREKDAPDAAPLKDPCGAVSLRDVSFSYRQGKRVLSHISLDIPPGTQVAIVGPTGCGKTTLVNLLLRFYDADEGEIFIDGRDVRSLTRRSVRAAYGMVLQDSWLRTGSVRENIALGREGAREEEIVAAARAARADHFIRALPNGYDTVIGEGGAALGEGQAQLLSIARAMLRDPAVLILDEATSSVDLRTEGQIRAAFADLLRGRTAFIIAHRLRTIENADLILVMRDGEVIERGTHCDLLAQNGVYAALHREMTL